MKTDGGALKNDQNGESVDDQESLPEPKESEMMDAGGGVGGAYQTARPLTKTKEPILPGITPPLVAAATVAVMRH